MEQLTLGIIGVVVSILAAATSLFTWFRVYQQTKYDVVDTMLHNIHRLEVDHPEFRDADFCAKAPDNPDYNVRWRYDAFATLVWNFLETLYDKYGERLRKGSFDGSMRSLARVHKAWIIRDENISHYNKNLLQFLRVTE